MKIYKKLHRDLFPSRHQTQISSTLTQTNQCVICTRINVFTQINETKLISNYVYTNLSTRPLVDVPFLYTSIGFHQDLWVKGGSFPHSWQPPGARSAVS